MSEKKLRAMLHDRNIIGSIENVVKGAIHDVTTLIKCASDVVQSLDDEVNQTENKIDLNKVTDLTDTLAEIGTDLEDDDDDDENNSASSGK